MTTIGVLSDTHISVAGKRQLPRQVFAAFDSVDLILHAGDLTAWRVISDLEALAPVVAVHGNCDGFEITAQLPTARRLEIEGCVIGLTHGDQPVTAAVTPLLQVPRNQHTAAHALTHFPDADCVIFGHSHYPVNQWHDHHGRRILLLNPGSPTDKRFAPQHSCARLRVDGQRLEAELIAW